MTIHLSSISNGEKSANAKENVAGSFNFILDSLICFEKQGTHSIKPAEPKKISRTFPWVAFGGLTLVTLLGLSVVWLAISFLSRYSSISSSLFSYLFKVLGPVLSVVFWPLKFLLSFSPIGLSSTLLPGHTTSHHCSNLVELQPWEVLNLVPGRDGNPQSIHYKLDSPTPHAITLVDIDYRDTRLEVFANGEFLGSTSDFVVDKSDYCGENLPTCIQKGFSVGTIVVPAGKQSVEIAWSGKDIFPGTDKIMWGANKRRRVMWKKDLCL